MKRSLNHSGDKMKDQGEREREEERRRERGGSSMSLANLRLNLLFIIKTFFSSEITIPGNCLRCFSGTWRKTEKIDVL